jgi:hypothetical protein
VPIVEACAASPITRRADGRNRANRAQSTHVARGTLIGGIGRDSPFAVRYLLTGFGYHGREPDWRLPANVRRVEIENETTAERIRVSIGARLAAMRAAGGRDPRIIVAA